MTAAALSVVLVLTAGAALRRAASERRAAAIRDRVESIRHAPGAPARVPRWFTAALAGAGVAGDPLAWWRTAAGGAALVLVLAWVSFGPGALVVVAVGLAIVPVVLGRLAGQRLSRRRAQMLPALLEDLARSLRGGASLRQALSGAAQRADPPLAGELGSVVAAIERGSPLVTELDAWCARDPSDDLRLTVAALALGASTGGRQARALDGVAATFRDRLAVERELRALSSQARASAAVMAVAPLCFALFTIAVDRRTAAFLIGSVAGLACLVGGLVLDAIAAVWMVRLTGSNR